ncbi:MAG TPA: BamA/TamA family outer membrane protein [Stellaceae bacterium]|nr:BamA/TamA family outer membrane protein [Stellaceae bacterium]
MPRLFLAVALACTAGAAAHADIRYKTQVVGAKGALSDLLGEVSQLKALEDRPPVSEQALRGRADRDLDQLSDAAHSLGYWSAHLSYRIDRKTNPQTVAITVKPGPLYHVAAIAVHGPNGKPLAAPVRPAALPLKVGDAARSEPVVATEAALVAAFKEHGHPFAKADRRRVIVDTAKHTMTVTYTVVPGPTARFGGVAISGLKSLRPGYVERRLRWRRGAPFDERKVAETRNALIASGLFSTVAVTPHPVPSAPGTVRMQIAVTERPHHTIGAGIGYNTSEGAEAHAFWENRNLFGNAEKLHLDLALGQQHKGAAADFRAPDVLAIDQDLLAHADVADETPVAYHSRRALVSTGLERRFGPHLTAGATVSLEKANVSQLANTASFTASRATQHYALIGLPLYVKLDESNSLLNPTKGYRVQASMVPYRSFSGPDLSFVSGRLSGSIYEPLTDDGRYVIAAAAAVSTIAGTSLASVPADKRIYAGGGGSVRAYGYEMAGPLDSNHVPIGGRSSLELSLEARIKITNKIGIVPFIDAGRYYETTLPNFGSRLLYGPGIGLRYYTAFGPLRVDLATPMVRRPGDSPVQFYISLGQAF